MALTDGRRCRACGRWLEQKGRGRPRKTCDASCEAVYQRALREHSPLPGDLIIRAEDVAGLAALANSMLEALADPEAEPELVHRRAHRLAGSLSALVFPDEVADGKPTAPALTVLSGGNQ